MERDSGSRRRECVGGMGCPLLSNCWDSCCAGKCNGFCSCCGSEGVVEDVGVGISVSQGAAPCHGSNLLMWKHLLPINMWSWISTRYVVFGTISAVMRYGTDLGAASVPPRLCRLGSAIFTRTRSPTRSVWNCQSRSCSRFCCCFIFCYFTDFRLAEPKLFQEEQ